MVSCGKTPRPSGTRAMPFLAISWGLRARDVLAVVDDAAAGVGEAR